MNQPVIDQDCLIEGEIFEGRFEILSLLSVGGVGAVYKARHTHMNKTVAIKVLLPSLVSDAADLRRFEQEASTASNLTHSNIVSIFDFGIASDGNAYLVMEYLDGRDLDDLIEQEGHIELDLFLRIFSQVCNALHHAHKRGVVHRDIKPSNIMVIDTEETTNVVKIVDFGLAKFTAPELQQNLTHAGVAVGTPLYMSPEQCRGGQLDHRSDIYSLGCVMYAALTGQVPFLGDSAMNTLSKHLLEAPPPFSVSAPQLNLPKPLEQVILQALQKEPGARQQSMIELRNDIASAILGPSVRAETTAKSQEKTSSQIEVPRPSARFANVAPPAVPRTSSLPALAFWVAAILVGSGIFMFGVSSWQRKLSQQPARIIGGYLPVETKGSSNSERSNIVIYDHSPSNNPDTFKNHPTHVVPFATHQLETRPVLSRPARKIDPQKSDASAPPVISMAVSTPKQPTFTKQPYSNDTNGLSKKEAAVRAATFEQEANQEFSAGDYRAARASYESCLQCQQSLYKHDHPRLFLTIGNILKCMEYGRFEGQFSTYLDQALSIFNSHRKGVMYEVERTMEATPTWRTFARACALTAHFSTGATKDSYLSWSADFCYLALESSPDAQKPAVAKAYCRILEERGNAAEAAAVRQQYNLPPPVKVDASQTGQNLPAMRRWPRIQSKGIWQR